MGSPDRLVPSLYMQQSHMKWGSDKAVNGVSASFNQLPGSLLSTDNLVEVS